MSAFLAFFFCSIYLYAYLFYILYFFIKFFVMTFFSKILLRKIIIKPKIIKNPETESFLVNYLWFYGLAKPYYSAFAIITTFFLKSSRKKLFLNFNLKIIIDILINIILVVVLGFGKIYWKEGRRFYRRAYNGLHLREDKFFGLKLHFSSHLFFEFRKIQPLAQLKINLLDDV